MNKNLQAPPLKESTHLLDDFNSSLNELKEEFHRTGRFDDANTKLDEITKLLTIKFLDYKNQTSMFDLKYLRNIAQEKFNDSGQIAKSLQSIFEIISNDKTFINSDGTNIFGSNPHLNIQSSDNDFAIKIINILNNLDLHKFDDGKSLRFDLLNEAFGHFVRDNFRNNKEDAQYMTPIEVVDTMIDLALFDILKEPVSKKDVLSKNDPFIILDPTCGVGTFITRASEKIQKIINQDRNNQGKSIFTNLQCIEYYGQDKVDRMVRLAKINCLFSGINPNHVSQGNSILGRTNLDDLEGKVDLILTNPPFGAEFDLKELDVNKQFEILPKIKSQIGIKTINSELIMLDKSLKLLKNGGRLLIIVPDSVVSAAGIYDIFRNNLSKDIMLRAVIDLPAVTFAQAGTRTKCSIVFLQKAYNNQQSKKIFMGVVNDIGYEVKERMGAPIKAYKGINELSTIADHFKVTKINSNKEILCEKPSIVLYSPELLIGGKWNANFYSASRIKVLNNFLQINSKDFEIKTLKQIAESVTKQRKKISVSDSIKCISVLHIKDDSTIQLEGVMDYSPLYPGYECFPEEILFSKINPRIPRIAVIPEIGFRLTCSTEFEIIKPYNANDTFLLRTLLLTEIVQKQVNSLTSGTSSSHNRIKEVELMNIQLPWPKDNSKLKKQLLTLAAVIEKEEKQKYKSNQIIRSTSQEVKDLIGIE